MGPTYNARNVIISKINELSKYKKSTNCCCQHTGPGVVVASRLLAGKQAFYTAVMKWPTVGSRLLFLVSPDEDVVLLLGGPLTK
jgi:hypothetical protein